MSLFDKDIVTKDPFWMKEGRDWMLWCIQATVGDFIKDWQDSMASRDFDADAMWRIAQAVRCVWLDNRSLLKQFNIDATSTDVYFSRTKEYKYDVVVYVRFIAHDLEDYVEFIRVPIIKL